MTMAYNIEPAHIDIGLRQDDTVDLTFDVYLNSVLFDMTGMRLDMRFRRKDGLLVKDYSSAGVAPAITIVTSSYSLYETLGFADADVLDYDLQCTDGADVFTIQEGEARIKKQIT